MPKRVFVRRLDKVLRLEPTGLTVSPGQTLQSPIVLADGTTYKLERAADTYVLYRQVLEADILAKTPLL